MMKGTVLAAGVLAAFLFVGCEKEDATKPVTTPPKPQSTLDAATDQAKKVSSDVTKATSDGMAAAETKAKDLMDQATTYIKENKLDMADKAVAQLESMRAQLPAAVQTQLDNVKEMLAKAKAAVTPAATPPAAPAH